MPLKHVVGLPYFAYVNFPTRQSYAFLPCQFAISMLGNRSEEGVEEFWNHCLNLPDWDNHPVFSDEEVKRGRYHLSWF